ncbi:hypothetical protein NL676_036565 [Syzygium grande]|nr:hypothetical protein NL676_036565 [Syzygium grande]
MSVVGGAAANAQATVGEVLPVIGHHRDELGAQSKDTRWRRRSRRQGRNSIRSPASATTNGGSRRRRGRS